MLSEGQRWRACVRAAVIARAGRRTIRAAASDRPPLLPAAGPDGRSGPSASVFVPKEESAPGERGELVYWRELAN